jgi:hypothetical protein
MSLAGQIRAFDSFDALFGPHGSHWAIAWFADRPRVIVELQTVVSSFDLTEASTSKGAGYHFLVSGGHRMMLHSCVGVDERMTEQALMRCTPEHFTSLLCDSNTRWDSCIWDIGTSAYLAVLKIWL